MNPSQDIQTIREALEHSKLMSPFKVDHEGFNTALESLDRLSAFPEVVAALQKCVEAIDLAGEFRGTLMLRNARAALLIVKGVQ